METPLLKDASDLAIKKANEFRQCNHPNEELRFFIAKNGAKQFRKQCKRCGQQSQNVAQVKLLPAEMQAAPRIDNELEKRHSEAAEKIFREEFERLKAQNKKVKQEIYAAYLNSPEWKRRREKIMARADNQCEACGDRRATQVHHLSYGSLFREPLWDLAAVCDECHGQLHTNLDEFFERLYSDDILSAAKYFNRGA